MEMTIISHGQITFNNYFYIIKISQNFPDITKFKRPKWSYKVFSILNESKMKVQVVSNFILVNNEGKNCLLAQTGQMKLKVDSKFKWPK